MIRVTRSVIPSLFTVMNLFSGFVAMVSAANGSYTSAAWMIVLGGIFDALDGAMARLTNSASEFGVELDSLADVVTFCAAPSFILYCAFFKTMGVLGIVISGLPAICGALRLARFNVQLVGFNKDYFRGMPTPSAAFILISYLVFYHFREDSLIIQTAKPAVITSLTIGISLLMVSTIKYDTFPSLSPHNIRKHPLKFALIIIAIALCLATKGVMLFPVMMFYLVFGIVRHAVYLFKQKNNNPDDDNEDSVEQSEASPFSS